MRADHPEMSERIFERAGAVAVKLVLDGPLNFPACIQKPLSCGVDVFNVNHEARGNASQCLRTANVALRKFIGQHDDRVTDRDFCMANPSVSHRHPKFFSRPQCLLVEVERLSGSFDIQIWGHRVISLWNRFHIACHESSLQFKYTTFCLRLPIKMKAMVASAFLVCEHAQKYF